VQAQRLCQLLAMHNVTMVLGKRGDQGTAASSVLVGIESISGGSTSGNPDCVTHKAAHVCVCRQLLVQDQVIGYFVFGLIRWEDRFAYIAGASAGLVGCLVGNSVQKLMDQKQFSRVMTALMFLCFCLMTASAAGWMTV
jgi:hypothetical protein